MGFNSDNLNNFCTINLEKWIGDVTNLIKIDLNDIYIIARWKYLIFMPRIFNK